MKITILISGKIREKKYLDKIRGYKKWISTYSKIDFIFLKDNNQKKLSENQIYHINKKNYSISLSEDGAQLNSIDFSRLITNKNEDILFIIGPPNGLKNEVVKKTDLKLSLSKLTFPYELSLLVLVEQIFRAISIKNGGKYHRV